MLLTFLVVLLTALLGLAICFFGYRLFLVMLPIWGFFAGLWLGAAMVMWLLGEGFLATVTGLLVGVVVGLVLAVLSYLFYIVGVALVAAFLGGALGYGLMTAIGFDPGFIVGLVAIISAVAVAVLALFFNLQKYVLILLTAIAGADLIVLAVLLLFGTVTVAELQDGGIMIAPLIRESMLGLIVWLVLTVAGIVLQLRANRTYEFTQERYVEAWG